MINSSEKIINKAENHSISQIFAIDEDLFYQVPLYQREYTWDKKNWETFFDDLQENPRGYYIGSIICIPIPDLHQHWAELVDGQQRLATISILMAAIYNHLNHIKEYLDEEEKTALINLKNRIIYEKIQKPRMILQRQNHNDEDYRSKLGELGLMKDVQHSKNAGNRKIYRAFKYFSDRLDKILEGKNVEERKMNLFAINDRVVGATIVTIEVDNHANAYTLFKSLNNSGVPLSALDIIKNDLLGTLERLQPGSIDKNYELWNRILTYLGEDVTVQERFFRQYLNSFMSEHSQYLGKSTLISRAAIIGSYAKLIANDAENLIHKLLEASRIYSGLICNDVPEDMIDFEEKLTNLQRIKGAPAYALLLYLFINRKKFNLDNVTLLNVIELINRFFIRRNLTDTPPTHDLDRLFMLIITNIHTKKQKGGIFDLIKNTIQKAAADDNTVKDCLHGAIYEENKDLARYVLCMLEESMQNRNNKENIGLWNTDEKGKYVWTIEHILPQGENLPDCWLKMLAPGKPDKAKEIQEEFAHSLGNLTLTAYNANLGNKCFEKKKEAKRGSKYIGYKNGLELNAYMVKANKWTAKEIKRRTDELANLTMALCNLDV